MRMRLRTAPHPNERQHTLQNFKQPLCPSQHPPQGTHNPLGTHPYKSALFDFQKLVVVILLLVCTCTYAHHYFPGFMDRNRHNYVMGIFWKCARIGERMSPYIALGLVFMAVSLV
ncbi:DUF1242-domain-containing protein [Karstenula rhodostoma CBS 690.94]|uniref:DUF1242-domain-containing protein n=1 Tax=Karstenula rhodostoma CBS 690.94 TaxID=1392251 RepID=A0A9P4U9Y6_9PLEO|nr:DUF1242-domain-containing protein [Karstenula rhodostoma CBS 690.94]